MPRTKKPAVAEYNPTLGPLVCDWIEEFLVHGPGDIQGQPIELDDEMRAFIWRCYEVHPKDHRLAGRRVYRRAILSRPKGRAKSEIAGMLACMEGVGPVKFDGWDANGDPVGAPVTSAVVRCFATEADQAGNTFDNVLYMMENGLIYDEYPGIDTGKVRINLPDGGFIVSTTSAATSKDGGKDTFDVFDETHLWTSVRLKSLHSTVTRNLVKRKIADGWALETSTMYAPGEESVAEETHQSQRDIPGVLFDHREAPADLPLKDKDGKWIVDNLREALSYVYGAASAWTNIDSIIEDEFLDPTKRESECRRYWLNQPWSAEEKFVTPGEWDANEVPDLEIPKGHDVALGFDGSFSGDSTGIVACAIVEGIPVVQVVGVWEKPEGARADWRVSRLDVLETIRQACKHWRVIEVAADPYMWAESLEELRDEAINAIEFPQSGTRMIPATKRFYDMIVSGRLQHSGDERLRRHVLNAILKVDARGARLSKVTKTSPLKIDLAVCAVMAVDRASAMLGAPEVWDLNEIVERLRREQEDEPDTRSGIADRPTVRTLEPDLPVTANGVPIIPQTFSAI